MKIENSVILVTGGASGIGEYIAQYLNERGAIVYISDVQETKGMNIQTESNGKIKFIKCDVTSEEEIKKMFEIIRREQGRLDGLINSAGIVWAEVIASEKGTHKPETYEKTLKINTYGSFLVSKYAAQLMIENAKSESECNGNIIFIASVAGFEGQKGQTAYSASKGALIGMTLPMARDLGKFKIRVNSIAPGVIETPLIKGFRETKVGKMLLASTPLKTLGKPLHVSQAAEFILICDFLNGTTIRVDGGNRLPHF